MKDTLVIFMTERRCRDAQYRIDRAFSGILGLCGEKRGNKENEVSGK
jgi:hypothetical protein